MAPIHAGIHGCPDHRMRVTIYARDPGHRAAKQCTSSRQVRREFPKMGESTEVKPGATWRQVVVRAYLISLGLAVLITVLTTLLLVDTTDCGSVERGLLVMAATTAVVFLASVVVVGVRVWKAIPGTAERLAIVVGYGAMLLASFVVITCGLMVVFNC
jgi:hypothetical protein